MRVSKEARLKLGWCVCGLLSSGGLLLLLLLTTTEATTAVVRLASSAVAAVMTATCFDKQDLLRAAGQAVALKGMPGGWALVCDRQHCIEQLIVTSFAYNTGSYIPITCA